MLRGAGKHSRILAGFQPLHRSGQRRRLAKALDHDQRITLQQQGNVIVHSGPTKWAIKGVNYQNCY